MPVETSYPRASAARRNISLERAQALSALLEDMHQQAYGSRLWLAVGEFGRSPAPWRQHLRQHAPQGRHHWPYCCKVLISGAGEE